MPDDDVLNFAAKLFGLAREGATAQLAAYVEAGADPDSGRPSAAATAQMFGRPDLLELLRA
jgi:uncharacterized protein